MNTNHSVTLNSSQAQQPNEPGEGAGFSAGAGSDPGGCNRYDLSFMSWFREHGWQIHNFAGQIDVWTNGDARCPFRVTRGMIDRLEWSGHLTRIFPEHAAILDYVWIASDQNNEVRRG